MLTDRLRQAMDRASALPAESQDAVAAVLEDLLRVTKDRPPPLRANVAAIVEQAIRDHAAMLEYLKDK